ncbi:MAG: hypothetical protein ACTHMX_08215 [Thermomicrobiales bacterium]
MTHDDSPPIPVPTGAGDPGPSPDGPVIVTAEDDDDIPAVRALILAAYPDVVPAMVAGATVADLLASVDAARAAYSAVAARITPVAGDPPVPPPVIPAGGGAILPIDPDRLPASEKIRRGLRAIPSVPGGTR